MYASSGKVAGTYISIFCFTCYLFNQKRKEEKKVLNVSSKSFLSFWISSQGTQSYPKKIDFLEKKHQMCGLRTGVRLICKFL